MTVSGILSGLANPIGVGFQLARAAVRVEPVAPVRPGARQADDARESDELDAGPSVFDTLDSVELSAAARSESELSDEEQARVTELKQRDREVRQHEAAHLAAAGPYARGGASFEYETGPDGRRYATGGEVQIDTSPVSGDPEATVAKMRQLQAAALAPADPSGQDRQIAASAAAEIQKARAEQVAQRDADASLEPDRQVSDSTPQSDRFPVAELVDTYA